MAKKDVIDRCNRYLNDNLNKVESFDKLTEDFTFDITILDQKNAKEIISKYTDYVMMLRSTYRDYRFNVENFERYVLRLNSVISSTLTIEYRIHDILYNKDYIKEIVNEVVEQEANSLIEYANEKLTSKTIEQEKKEEITELKKLINGLTNQIKNNTSKRTDKLLSKQNIEEMKKDYYFIGNISKDKELKELIEQICQIYIENELISTIREEIYKKHKIVIKNKSQNEIHCLKLGAYSITSNKIEQVIALSTQNHKKNIIEDKTQKLFNTFLSLEKATNKKEYKEIINKYKKEAVKEIETKQSKYFLFGDLIKDYTISILKELGWCINE